MSSNQSLFKKQQILEFSPGKDPFEKSRRKGTLRWILSHIFHGSNKIFIFIVLFTTVFASILNSAITVNIGFAVEEFVNANLTSIALYTIIILVLGLI
ncbi:MAG: hypothetical protein ACFE75_13905, partial [Candidatus Hodarchaeota archaeon]